MAGIEGGPRGGEPTPQKPRQAEQTQPLQGRAEGRASLQGPTTVDGSAHGGSDRTLVQQGKEKRSSPGGVICGGVSIFDLLHREDRKPSYRKT